MLLLILAILSTGLWSAKEAMYTGEIAEGKGILAGKVTVMGTDKPLAGVAVELVGRSHSTITDEKGIYRLVKLKPGTYRMRFIMKKYISPVTTGIVVKSGKVTVHNTEI